MGRRGLSRRPARPQKKLSMTIASKQVKREYALELLEKKRAKDRELREKAAQHRKLLKRFRFNYAPNMHVLLVGEANCSFARAIIRQYRHDIAAKLRSKNIPIPSPEEYTQGMDPAPEDIAAYMKNMLTQTKLQDQGIDPKTLAEMQDTEYVEEADDMDDEDEDDDGDDDMEDEDDDDIDEYYKRQVDNVGEYLFSNCGRNLIVTCYDSLKDSLAKYEDLPDILTELYSAGVQVIFDFDCRTMHTTLAQANLIPPTKFDRIVFNFPHTGSGEQDKELNIRENQQLLLSYLTSGLTLLRKSKNSDKTLTENLGTHKVAKLDRGGQISITVKNGAPYDAWKIPVIARMLNHNQAAAQKLKETAVQAHPGSLAMRFPKLMVYRVIPFLPECYDGYAHRRTIGFKEGISKADNEEVMKQGAKTYIFIRAPVGFVDKSLGLAHEEEPIANAPKKKKKLESGKRGKSGRGQLFKAMRVARLKKKRII